jgi:hypothetical protein
MVTALFTAAKDALTGMLSLFTDGVTGIAALFWDGTALTILGTLLVIPLGVGVVWFVFKFIRGLIPSSTSGR